MTSIVLPVYNEEIILRENTLKVFEFCRKNLEDDWQIIISDNNSRDETARIGKELAQEHERIEYYYTESQGKGYGVIGAWEKFPADVYVFMDADLATDLETLPELVGRVKLGECDIAVGSRFEKKSEVEKSLWRKIPSWGLRMMLKIFLGIKTKDAPCGFKAADDKVIKEIIPKIKNREWFFDTEMIFWAEKNRMNIKEIPIKWAEPKNKERKSRVGIIKVSREYLKNIKRLRETAK